MPLTPGKSKKTIYKNIKEMIEAGHDPKQAEAAAYSNAGEYKKPEPKKKKAAPKARK